MKYLIPFALVAALALTLAPVAKSATPPLTVPQGGTGTSTFPVGWFITAASPTRLTATSTLSITTSGNIGTNLSASSLVSTNATGQLTAGVDSITAANVLNSVNGTTGTAGNLVFSASPTLSGVSTIPTIRGGTGAGSDLVFRGSTNASPTPGTAGIVFQAGANGTTEAGRFDGSTGFFGLATSSPGTIFSIGSLLNFSTATSTFYSSGGLNLSGGCFAINGTCITGGGGSGLTNLNGQTGNSQTFATTSSSGGWGFSSAADVHTLNIPTASASNPLGLLSSTDWSTFDAKQAALSFVYPLVNAANSVSLAFGTTTANSWSQLQTFDNHIRLTDLATAAGSFLAVDGDGDVIATSTPSGGGGTPGGASGALQYNNAGAFGGFGEFDGSDVSLNGLGLYAQDIEGDTIRFQSSGTGGILYANSNVLTDDAPNFNYDADNIRLGIGTSSPYAKLSVVGDVVAARFVGTTTATSTFGGGLDISSGCFAINGTCVGAGGGGSGTVGSGTTGQTSYYAANGTTLTATSSLFMAANGYVGVGTTNATSRLTIDGAEAVAGGIGIKNSSGHDWRIWAPATGAEGSAPAFRIGGSTAGDYFWQGGYGNTIANEFRSPDANVSAKVLVVKGAASQADSYLEVRTSGATAGDILTINSSGNVGIGTTSPLSRLSVRHSASSGLSVMDVANTSASGISGVDFYSNTGVLEGGFGYGNASSPFYADAVFLDALTNKLVLSASSQNVEILGTASGASPTAVFTPAGLVGIASSTPGTLFSIGGVANFTTATSTFHSSGGLNLTGGCYAVNGTCVGAGGGGSGTVGSGTTGQMPYYAGAGTTLTATSSLFMAASGYVGVGNSSPVNPFSVLSTATDQFRIAYDGSNEVNFDVSSAGTLTIDPTLNISFMAGGSNRWLMSGNDLRANTASGPVITNQNASDTNPTVLPRRSDADTGIGASANGTITLINNGAATMQLSTGNLVGIGTTSPVYRLSVQHNADANMFQLYDTDGNCLMNPEAGGITTTCSSDGRLKENVRDASSALAHFAGLRIRDYTVKASGDTYTGVIAQEMRQSNPELVKDGADGFLQVELPNLWKLVKAIQELVAWNNNQDTRLSDLERRLDALERENAALRGQLRN